MKPGCKYAAGIKCIDCACVSHRRRQEYSEWPSIASLHRQALLGFMQAEAALAAHGDENEETESRVRSCLSGFKCGCTSSERHIPSGSHGREDNKRIRECCGETGDLAGHQLKVHFNFNNCWTHNRAKTCNVALPHVYKNPLQTNTACSAAK